MTRVLDVLTERRLLTVGAGAVEVAHEALLREWPRLRRWLEEDAEGRRVRRHLAHAAREWDGGGRDRGELYRSARLASALEWRADHEPELTAVERAFLDAGRAASERARRRSRLVLAGVLGLLVDRDRRGAAGARRPRPRPRAGPRRRGAAARRPGDDRGVARPLAAARTSGRRPRRHAGDARQPARGAAPQPGRGRRHARRRQRADQHRRASRRAHRRGRRRGRHRDLPRRPHTRRLAAPHESDGLAQINSVAFSPDGTRLASTGWDRNGGFVDLFDGRAHRHLARLDTGWSLSDLGAKVAFSADSRVLALETDAGVGSARWLRWDARTGRLLTRATDIPGRSAVVLGFAGSRARDVEHRGSRDGRPRRREACARCASTPSPARPAR